MLFLDEIKCDNPNLPPFPNRYRIHIYDFSHLDRTTTTQDVVYNAHIVRHWNSITIYRLRYALRPDMYEDVSTCLRYLGCGMGAVKYK